MQVMLSLLISIDLEVLSLPLRKSEIVISDREILSRNLYYKDLLNTLHKQPLTCDKPMTVTGNRYKRGLRGLLQLISQKSAKYICF